MNLCNKSLVVVITYQYKYYSLLNTSCSVAGTKFNWEKGFLNKNLKYQKSGSKYQLKIKKITKLF
jgi:hypothetical protein